MAKSADKADKKLKLGGKRNLTIRIKDAAEEDAAITSMMMDSRYLRQSASLIQEALQKGYDVLQLANGDIVTTGTKTIVYRYTWDEDKGALKKIKVTKEDKEEELSDSFVGEDA